VKHLPPSTVLAAPFWVSDAVTNASDGLWLRVPEETFYGVIDIDKPMPRIAAYVQENPVTHIEAEGLICFPIVEGSRTYDKGIVVRQVGEGRYEIGSLTVDYTSDRLTAIGVSLGYTYTLQDNRFVRQPSAGDCPCGDPEKHNMHLRALAVLDDMLGSARIERKNHIASVGL
jgi:hypothetical protein